MANSNVIFSVILLMSVFPEKVGVDYSALMMTPEGEYSITKRADGKKLLQKIVSVVGSTKRKHITDLTGNVGGDTIMFSLNFGHVEAIEIDKDNFEALKNNVKVFKLKNVTLHQGDATKLFRWKTDILYVDPPWGGPDYKEKQNLDLYLGKERIDEFISLILQQEWRPHYVFIKLPRNYAFERLRNLPNVVKEHKFAIRGFFLVGLEVE
jgi:16S rRNA G966 N2-methylase RsmD